MLRTTLLACVIFASSLRAQEAWPDEVLCPPDSWLPPPSEAGDDFGRALSLVDGRLVVGAPNDGTMWGGARGAVYLYELADDGLAWTAIAKFSALEQGTSVTDEFGWSIAQSGALLAVGAPKSRINGSAVGWVDLFVESPFGPYLHLGHVSPPSGAHGITEGSRYGEAVALSGSTLLISAPWSSIASQQPYGGVIFEYYLSPFGGWWQVDVLAASDAVNALEFGRVMVFDGETLLVGAPGLGSSSQQPVSACYVFQRGVSGKLVEVAKLSPTSGTPAGFGSAIALDGDRALVGFIYTSDQTEGAVLFEQGASGTWVQVAILENPASISHQDFGFGVALHGDDAFVSTRQGFVAYRRGTTGQWSAHTVVTHGVTPAQFGNLGRPLVVDELSVVLGVPEATACVTDGLATSTSRRSLNHGIGTSSIATAGTQDLFLDFGLAGAGRFYFMLGSLTGTVPGIALPNSKDTLPLVFDAYTELMLDRPSLTVANAWGQLDELGRADAQFRVPNGLDPSFAGLVLHHAAVTLDATTGALAASNAVAVELVP